MADRRGFLKLTGGAAAAGTFGLAGCTGGGGGDGGDGGDEFSDYPSQEVQWKNGGSSGGGFDQYSRAIAQFMPNNLPGDGDIVVQTMGSWTQANSQIYRADPDGYTLGIVNIPGNIVTQVLQDPPWDLTELSWFGRVARSVYAMGVASDGPVSSWEDLKDLGRPARFATTGQGTSTLSTILGATALGIDFELVTGYAGSPEMVTGLLRGDADALQLPATTTPMANAIEEGEVTPVLYYGEDPTEFGLSSDVPTVSDAGQPELEGQANLQRSVAAPPGASDALVSFLESAFQETVQSDEFTSWAEEQGRPVSWTGAEEISTAVTEAVSFIEDNADVFDQYL
jgi:tripartite-type tricarboxylate transporter receptor subunit TctC